MRTGPSPELAKRSSLCDEELDHTPLPIGQYRGQTPSQISEHDPSYLTYLAEHADWKVASDLLLRECMESGG